MPDIRSIETGVATHVDAPEQVYGVFPPLKTGLDRTSVIFLAMIGQSPSRFSVSGDIVDRPQLASGSGRQAGRFFLNCHSDRVA
jgi:hypothetical protein